MTKELVTIVGATLGDSAGHLNRQFLDLKQFTSLPFKRIICDDGTIDEEQKARQRYVCRIHDADWFSHPGPTYGISYAWNAVMERVTTPWAFCVEDGLRPSMGWLETAVDAIERIGNKTWLGHKVGMIGTAHFNDWHLALAGMLPTHLGVMDFLHRTTAECYSAFWGGGRWPNWNDGYICWRRMWPMWQEKCASEEADHWPKAPAPWNFVHLIRHGRLPGQRAEGNLLPHAGIAIEADPARISPVHLGLDDNWPRRRRAAPGWFPGAFMLLNTDAWRAVGRFTDGCPFFEGSLGIRMAQHGYLSLYMDFPPWLHFGGMGFINADRDAKKPRDHRPTDEGVPGDCLKQEFGINGPSHVDLYSLVYKTFPAEKQAAIAQELAAVDLYMDKSWELWL